MATDEPPRKPFYRRRPQALIRLGVLSVAIVGAGLAFALMWLPAARGLGTMAQRFEEQVGCKGASDIQFPRFPERSSILSSDGRVLAHIYLDENRNIVKLDKIAHIARQAVWTSARSSGRGWRTCAPVTPCRAAPRSPSSS
jgi:hypothetical protein